MENKDKVWLPPKLRTDPKRPWASNFFGDDPFLRHEDEPDSVLDKEEYDKSMGLYEESLEDEQMFGRSRKALDIIEQGNSDKEILSALFKEFVPASGPADTVGGEVVRAINRIAYRWTNDGDQIGLDYGVETVNPPYQYLIEKDIIVDNYDGDEDTETENYNEFINDLLSQVVDTLHNRPELFDEKNEENSNNGNVFRYYLELDTYEDEDDDEGWM